MPTPSISRLLAALLSVAIVTPAMPAPQSVKNNDPASGALMPRRSVGTVTAPEQAAPAPAPAPVVVPAPVPAPPPHGRADAPTPAPAPARKPVAVRKPERRAAAPAPAPVAAPTPPVAQSRCSEEDAAPSRTGRDASSVQGGPNNEVDPRTHLQELMQLAQERSKSIGAARLLTQAAEADLAEAKAARLPQVMLSGTAGYAGTMVPDVGSARGLQGTASLSVSAPIYDFGRIAKLSEFRANLADAAKQGQRSAEEQLALQTVSLALDRSRYTLQAQVFAQYVRKMACLVDALEIITKADRGRASELVQAHKSYQQADLSLEQTFSALRQTELRLRRFVGEELPPVASLSAVLARIPDVNDMMADSLIAPDIAQATAQAKAQRSLAESVQAGQKPSVSFVANTTKIVGVSNSTNWVIGANVSVPLYQPGAAASLTAAQRRYQAADLQRDETIEAKRYRILDIHEQASATLDRAQRIVDILRNSDRVRASTLQQWQQLGRRSLFDVMAAEGDYYSMRVAHVNALFDVEQLVALMWSMGRGVAAPLR